MIKLHTAQFIMMIWIEICIIMCLTPWDEKNVHAGLQSTQMQRVQVFYKNFLQNLFSVITRKKNSVLEMFCSALQTHLLITTYEKKHTSPFLWKWGKISSVLKQEFATSGNQAWDSSEINSLPPPLPVSAPPVSQSFWYVGYSFAVNYRAAVL